MARGELVRQLSTAREEFCGIGTKRAKLQLNQFAKSNVIALAFRIALEIEDCSTLGKKYHGKWSDHYYEKKQEKIIELMNLCAEQNWIYGKHNSDLSYPKFIIYFELPGCEQISFHTDLQNPEIPDYPKDWDGKRNSTLGKLEAAISEILKDKVLEKKHTRKNKSMAKPKPAANELTTFVIKKSVLKDELGMMQGVIEKKSTIPVLSNILIESVGDSTVRFFGTDLDVYIRCDVGAEVVQAGSMCVQARKLFDIVRLLDGDDVHFVKDANDWVNLKCGKSNFRLAGVGKDNFPEVPAFKSTPLKLSAEIFNHFINNTAFAITNEQSRFTLSGAKFIVAEDVVKMITTDGHRLAYIEKPLTDKFNGSMDALIPKKALTELLKVLRGYTGDVSFGEDPNHIYFEVEGRLLITRKLSGTFPQYDMVIPKDNDKVAIFDAEEMKNALRRVSLMAEENTHSIKLTVREGEIEISAQSSEEGEAHEAVVAEYSGDEMQLGFNAKYLQDFLNIAAVKVSESDKEADAEKTKEPVANPRIAFNFKNANGQTEMNIAGDTSYKYVVMPLRI